MVTRDAVTDSDRTIDPKTLKDHPGQSRTSNGIVSTATGRSQLLKIALVTVTL
ncbi:hypothetical protein HW132_02010 [Brasilonema sp. CT11]|nr:hypothetical protein [Brasilonema sp. CT11]